MLLSLVFVATLVISSMCAFMGGQSQQGVDNYVSPYDEDPSFHGDNLNFYNTYVQTHPYQPNFNFDDNLHHHHGFHHFPGNINLQMFVGPNLPPPSSPYDLCFKPIYLSTVRSNSHLVNFCTRYARFINRVPFLPKVPMNEDIEGSGMEGFL